MRDTLPATPSREHRWELLQQPWDIVIIGGGITGAGILWEAARQGHRTVLLEQRDFAWGSSSRSGQLVHGGLRYLRQGQVRLSRQMVQERDRLLRELPGLVVPLGIVLPLDRRTPVRSALFRIGLILYDLLAGRRSRRALDRATLRLVAPYLQTDTLSSGLWYRDALTDDARLVLRAIRQGEAAGGVALNYARVADLCQTRSGAVEGVVVRDAATGRTVEVRAGVVINATGIWADRIRGALGRPPRLRLLRGSHLIFPAWRLPVAQGINLLHPGDGRPLYVLPWEGVTLVGTTDLDHTADLDEEPRITPQEAGYLLEAVRHGFPTLDLSERDVLATFAGVRAVVGTGRRNPSRESRAHVVWTEGIITVTGGKLTTFRLLARDALRHARRPAGRRLPGPAPRTPAVTPLPIPSGMETAVWPRLAGRYGPEAAAVIAQAGPGELEPVAGTTTRWAEIRWGAGEAVVHLDDLLLRRVRLGLQAPQGGVALLDRIRPLVQARLGWDETRWQMEASRYAHLWSLAYSPPTGRES